MSCTPADVARQVLADVVDRALGEHALKPTLTVEQVAEILGLGRTAAYDAVNRGDIAAIRLGHRLVVPTAWLVAQLLGSHDSAGLDGRVVPFSKRETS